METSLTAYDMFARSANFFPHEPAVIFIDKTGGRFFYCYKQLLLETNRYMRSFSWAGIKKGDRIVLLLPNSPRFVKSYLALSKIGAIPVLVNPALPSERISRIIEDTKPRYLIKEGDPDLAQTEGGMSAKVPCDGAEVPCDGNDTSVILYSSGTTGEQKGVELTVDNLYHNIRATTALTGITPRDRSLCFLPLTHCFGLNFVMGSCFHAGATLVLHEKFDASRVLESLVRDGVTMFFAVPMIYKLFLRQHIDPAFFATVRYFFYAADALSENAIREWERHYGRTIYTGWGLTETSPFATSNHQLIHKPGSVGKPIPGVEIKIRKEGYEPSGIGEICVRGHNVMKGYWNQPEATAEAIDTDGWFHTGDAGVVDADDHIFVVGRLKDMINVGGEKAWPAEIEQQIMQHPGIADVAVIGSPHEIMGEVPVAFVVLKDPTLTALGIQEFIKPKLRKHEFPREIFFVETLPRNPSGKILRRVLREQISKATS